MSGWREAVAFTPETRDRARTRVLELARSDPRVIAGAEVGSRALGPGDRWSDLDLTFGLAPGITLKQVLDEWTPVLEQELEAVPLFDLPHLSTLYRVFLLPGALQVDLSCTPGHEFGALGPKFRLLFGAAVERARAEPPTLEYLFGVAVHDAVRARFTIERGRLGQAEYLLGELRHTGLAMACRRRDLDTRYGRGVDELPPGLTARFAGALVCSLDGDELLRALACGIDALLTEAFETPEVRERALRLEQVLRGLTRPGWPEPSEAS